MYFIKQKDDAVRYILNIYNFIWNFLCLAKSHEAAHPLLRRVIAINHDRKLSLDVSSS